MDASSITSETLGKVAHPPPRLSVETDRRDTRKRWMVFIGYSVGNHFETGGMKKLFMPPVSLWREPPLFHNQVVFHRLDPFNAACDLARFIDGLLGFHEAAQLDGSLVGFDADLE